MQRRFVLFLAAACTDPPRSRGGVDSADPATDSATPQLAWRSSLYPEDWTPGFETEHGRLRDFSHAGYRGGGVDLPVPAASAARSALDHGADPTGATDSTAAIQAAVDAGPGTIWFPPGRYRVDGQLTVSTSGTVLLGAGSAETTLWFTSGSLNHSAHLRFAGRPAAILGADLTRDVVPEDASVGVAAGSGIEVGDEVWVGITITDAFAADHGMEEYWGFSRGAWRPFFRRTVTAVEAGTDGSEEVHLDVSLPYALGQRDGARIEVVDGYLEGVGLAGVAVTNAVDWETAWSHDQVHAVSFDGVRDAWMRDVASEESQDHPGFHLQSSGVLVRNSRRVTLAELNLGHSQNRGEGGNGYLIEVRTSNAVLVRDSTAVAGRHNLIQNWDFGTSDLVFLRTHSAGAEAFTSPTDDRGALACSETHHALAIAVLVDHSTVTDCWKLANRLAFSSGAGHTATESVFWNVQGSGELASLQYGRGYVVGTQGVTVRTEVLDVWDSLGTQPEDFVEGEGQAESLEPASLYEDQLARRLATSSDP